MFYRRNNRTNNKGRGRMIDNNMQQIKKHRQQELEYIRVQLVCLLPYQTLEKAYRRLNRIITEIEELQEYDR